MAELILDPTFWVAVALGLFVALVWYLGVPGLVAKQLDARADAIRAELDQAKRLREEAAAVLKDYEAKRALAEADAQKIVAGAQAEALRLAEEARAALQAQIERKTRAAEQKILQAESAALAEIRAAAAAAATKAAAQILQEHVTGAKADEITEAALRDLRAKLH
jgi:F-type H+-transporting ATPase subunit b